MSVAETLRRNRKITSTTSDDRQHQRELHVVHRFADGLRAVVDDIQLHRGRHLLAERRAADRLIRSTTSTVLVPGWRCTTSMMERRVVEPAGHLVVLDAVDDAAQFLQPHRRAVAVGDDQRAVCCGGLELAVGLHGEGLLRPPQRAGGQVDVVLGQGRLHLVDADAARRQQVRVELDAHGVLLRAEHVHLRHAADHRDALRHHRLGVLVHHGERQRRASSARSSGWAESAGLTLRKVGGVGMPGGRRRVHAAMAACTSCAAASMSRSRANCSVMLVLPRVLRRGHRIEAGDGRELPLQRRRHGGRHGFGTGAGQAGAHLNGREIDVGQIADRQARDTRQRRTGRSRHDQRGHDRPADENLSDVHRCAIS